MKTTPLMAFTGVLAAALQVASAGDITGTVTLNGTPPAEKDIVPLKSDPLCGKLHSSTIKTAFYVVGPNKELADVVVVLKGDNLKGKSTGGSAAPVTIDQKGCLYTPQIVAVQTGQKVVVKNSDPVLHNVRTVPTAGDNKAMNLAQMAGGPDLTTTFNAPENFLKFQCDVHPWMFSWVTVVDHPYFAVSGKDGSFKISNVPPGKYTITALHRKAAVAGVNQEIEVKDDGAKVTFALDAK